MRNNGLYVAAGVSPRACASFSSAAVPAAPGEAGLGGFPRFGPAIGGRFEWRKWRWLGDGCLASAGTAVRKLIGGDRRGLRCLSCGSWLPATGSQVSGGRAGFPASMDVHDYPKPGSWECARKEGTRRRRCAANAARPPILRPRRAAGLGSVLRSSGAGGAAWPRPATSVLEAARGLYAWAFARSSRVWSRGVPELPGPGQPGGPPLYLLLLLLQTLLGASYPSFPQGHSRTCLNPGWCLRPPPGILSGLKACSLLVSATFNFADIKSYSKLSF